MNQYRILVVRPNGDAKLLSEKFDDAITARRNASLHLQGKMCGTSVLVVSIDVSYVLGGIDTTYNG